MTSHKISLIIQAQLGGIELPPDNTLQKQFQVEKCIVFERLQRLIRCVIDCKLWDCDATATRHSLKLARSLAAGYWENSSLQLRQIPGVGPAGQQKFVNGNINSIEKLVTSDTATIERIMRRNPPFGRKTLDSLVGFPCLSLTVEIHGQPLVRPGEYPKVNIRVVLGYKNTKIPVWNHKKPSLTFTAATTGGALAYFWRGNIQNLINKHNLKFDIELCEHGEEITCQVACDEIVGTLQSFTLKPNISASSFPPPKIMRQGTKPKALGNRDEVDEFGGDEYDDDEFLAAIQGVEEPKIEYGSDDVADTGELDEGFEGVSSKESKPDEAFEPMKMENGRWACNHPCSGRNPLKNGLLCKHKCCIEGLDKPRKVKKKASD